MIDLDIVISPLSPAHFRQYGENLWIMALVGHFQP
jgi:hypothetical protein